MKSKVIIILIVAAIAAVVVYFVSQKSTGIPADETSRPASRKAASDMFRESIAKPTQENKISPDEPVTRPARRENGWAEKLGTNRLASAEKFIATQPRERPLNATEEALIVQAREFAANRDAVSARAFANVQQKSPVPQVREAAVFALANCGSPCLAELTPYLADSDEGVRTEAMSAWRSEWFAMPNDRDKAEAAVAIMCVVNDDAALEPIAAELMKFDRATALEALSVVLEKGTDAGRAQASRISTALGTGAK